MKENTTNKTHKLGIVRYRTQDILQCFMSICSAVINFQDSTHPLLMIQPLPLQFANS